MIGTERAVSVFAAQLGGRPTTVVRSPGRVNLIGDHTDYNDGFVLPLAIDLAVNIAFRPRGDDTVRLWSERAKDWAEFSLDALARGGGWGSYIQGVASEMVQLGLAQSGWEGVLVSDIPSGAGLSSSAALELSAARTFALVSEVEWDAVEMALLCQRAENDWVGVNCGIMDQLVCATGEVDRSLLIDCRDLTRQAVPIPHEATVVVLDTGTERRLVDSGYNERRESCETAARLFEVKALRDLDIETLESGEDRLDAVTYRRALHVVTENERTLLMAECLDQGDLVAAGELMRQSHTSLRDDFEVSSDALNSMTESALLAPGCFGARMTGGGFGGSCVALVATGRIEEFREDVLKRYQADSGLSGTAIPIKATGGTSFESLV